MTQEGKSFLDIIKTRKSIRNFIFQKINKETINDILDCGRWAPSGGNVQPWKVSVVEHPTVKRLLADNSKYGGIIESAYINICVFLDIKRGYDRTKDIQAIGAFIQNILLAIHAKGLGAVWIGEILSKKDKVAEIFKLNPDEYELMCVIAVGVVDDAMEKKSEKLRERRSLDEFVDWY